MTAYHKLWAMFDLARDHKITSLDVAQKVHLKPTCSSCSISAMKFLLQLTLKSKASLSCATVVESVFSFGTNNC